jgi:NAD(P)-dependent dehydrogenase (short-subunit alcohol dehydrogenase family)
MTDPDPRLDGQVCLVTGGTAGLGRVVARELASRGATVYVVGRNAARGRAAVEAIRAATGNEAVAFLAADLSVQAQVHALADTFLARHDRLHVLVNNAGAMYALRQESADGIELTLALDHLAPFVLTTRLADALRRAAPARVVTLSSEAHRDVPGFDFADPQAARTRGFGRYPRNEWESAFYTLALPMAHPGFLQYARCKLANVLFTTELARRFAGTGVTANAANPGMVASEFSAGNGIYGWFLRRMVALRGIGVEEGAATTVHLATSPRVATESGGYYTRCERVDAAPAGNDAAAAEQLWALSERLTAR